MSKIEKPQIDETAARALVEQYLKKPTPYEAEIEYVILDEHTIETEFGWVFFFDSKKHFETNDFQYAIAGNTPLIVDRADGSIHPTGTARSAEYYIQQYRAKRGKILRAQVVFFTENEGGRNHMPSSGYRPHFSTKPGEMLGVRIIEISPSSKFGEPTEISFELVYPLVDYSSLTSGSKFKILEGKTVVGSGNIAREQ